MSGTGGWPTAGGQPGGRMDVSGPDRRGRLSGTGGWPTDEGKHGWRTDMFGSNRERMSVRYILEAAQQLDVSYWGGRILRVRCGRTSFTYCRLANRWGVSPGRLANSWGVSPGRLANSWG